jgi:LmbE family N-acetylglucosaminyl deacetylase
VSELPGSALVLAPHADDEAMGCSGLMARMAAEGARIHVLYLAVDGFHHYGLEQDTTFEARVAERELVDRFEAALNSFEPELLLIPAVPDYDQDHTAVFHAAVAAARPIARQFGKWLVPEVLTYEMAKIQWASEPLPRFAAFCDITDVLETKLESIRRYETMLRPSPHIRSLEGVRALATIRGAEIGVAYAEAFGVLRSRLG